ncbi:MAG TPA: sugar transferase [Rhizomicrobium sp.]|nr:sugar transferase [Rhizomicrobium sp.]
MTMHVGDAPAACLRTRSAMRPQRESLAAQRFMDCVICLLAVPFAIVVGLFIALLIRLDGGPVFYSQRRVGRGGQSFDCLKFRSMVPDADERLQEVLARDTITRAEWENYQKLANDPRITRIGKLIRATSLDELPQLLNVWRGEMSIVGPRPIMVDQISLYGEHFGDYCTLRPGITGLWQITGRNECTFAERVRLDMEYASNWSVLRDIQIVILTIPAVLAGKGAR